MERNCLERGYFLWRLLWKIMEILRDVKRKLYKILWKEYRALVVGNHYDAGVYIFFWVSKYERKIVEVTLQVISNSF